MEKKHTRNVVVLLLCFTGLFFILAKGLVLDPNQKPTAHVHQPATGFTLDWIQGQDEVGANGAPLTLSLFRGKWVVLNFWASWCSSCGAEAKELEAFWKKYKDQDIIVLGVAVHDQLAAAKKFAAYFGKTYPLGLDVSGKVSLDYGVSGVPETFLIDKDGVIQERIVGPVTLSVLEQKLHLQESNPHATSAP